MFTPLIKRLLPNKLIKNIQKKRLQRRTSKPVQLWGQFRYGGYRQAYTTVERYGVPEVHVAEFIADNVWPGDVCVDIGAHFGFYTLLMALYTEKNGYVYAFEPEDETRGILQKNIGINDIQHVKICDTVIGDKTGDVTWINSSNSQSHVAHDLTTLGISKSSISLDDWFKKRTAPNFLKIDVEGYELEVLSGAIRTLAHHKPKIIIEIHPSVIKQTGLYKIWHLLNDIGYEMHAWRLQIAHGHCISKYKLSSPELFLGGHIAAIPT
ncbi:FkbM family methyltransferase [Anaerolineales bacterium HSG24]|nr:FkbM family methyltransferase [Anaerolineales bacterium HSG24]